MALDSILQDVRHAARGLRRAPLFSATVAGTLGLGLGLVASAFTILNAYVFAPIDLPNPHELYTVSWDNETTRRERFRLADYEELRASAPDFSQLAATHSVAVMRDTRTVSGSLVTGNYFEMLGARPSLGRLLRPDDASAPGAGAVVVLSHSAWRSLYGSDPAIVGQRIQLGRQRYEVVGVTEPYSNLAGQEFTSFFAPLTMAGAFAGSNPWSEPESASLMVVGRLASNATADSARAWLDNWLRQRFPPESERRPVTVNLESLATRLPVNGGSWTLFALIMPAFGLVLLVACANVTNLMLARALARQPEVAVRLALGASRWRVARQLIVESLVLALPAAAAGLALAVATARAFPAIILATFPVDVLPVNNILVPLDPDLRVLAFLAAMAVLAAVLISLAPASRLTRVRLTQASRGEASPDARGARLRSGLIAMQIGACALFLVGAVGLIDESIRIANPQPNLNYQRVAEVRVDAALLGTVATRLALEPAVERVAVAIDMPLAGRTLPTINVTASTTEISQGVGYTIVSPEYFALFDIPIVRGRTFTPVEADAAAAVAVVSAATAAALWPGLDPVGQTLVLGPSTRRTTEQQLPQGSVRVIGVVEDVANGSILEGLDDSCVYLPSGSNPPGATALLVRARSDDTSGLRAAVAAAVADVAPDATFRMLKMPDVVRGITWVFQAFSVTASLLGIVGLLLAYSGTHAVVSFLVAQRTREFGLRMALGASASRIVWGMLAETSRIVAVGLAAGLMIVAALVGAFGGSIPIVPEFGPRPYLIGAAVVLAATAIAALLPLRDAARIDPAQALRAD